MHIYLQGNLCRYLSIFPDSAYNIITFVHTTHCLLRTMVKVKFFAQSSFHPVDSKQRSRIGWVNIMLKHCVDFQWHLAYLVSLKPLSFIPGMQTHSGFSEVKVRLQPASAASRLRREAEINRFSEVNCFSRGKWSALQNLSPCLSSILFSPLSLLFLNLLWQD